MKLFWIGLFASTFFAYGGFEDFHEQRLSSLDAKATRAIMGADYDEAVRDLKVLAHTELAWNDKENLPRLRLESNAINGKYGSRALPRISALTILLKIGEPEILEEVSRRFADFESEPGLRFYPTPPDPYFSGLGEHFTRWKAIFDSGNPGLLKPLCVKLLKADPSAHVRRLVELDGHMLACDSQSLSSARYTVAVLSTAEGIPAHVRSWAEGFLKHFERPGQEDYVALVTVICNLRAFAELNRDAIAGDRFTDLAIPTESQVERIRANDDVEVKTVELSPRKDSHPSTESFDGIGNRDLGSKQIAGDFIAYIGVSSAVLATVILWFFHLKRKRGGQAMKKKNND